MSIYEGMIPLQNEHVYTDTILYVQPIHTDRLHNNSEQNTSKICTALRRQTIIKLIGAIFITLMIILAIFCAIYFVTRKEDERKIIYECLTQNGGCNNTQCVNTDGSANCRCHTIYKMSSNNDICKETTCKCEPLCQDPWIFYQGHCYLFHTNKTNWQAAQNDCKRMGSSLVKIGDTAENIWIKSRMRVLGSSNMWIGANDKIMDGHFTWISDGSGLVFTDWDDDEPNGHDGSPEDCIEIREHKIWSFIIYRWNDLSCLSLREFICEK